MIENININITDRKYRKLKSRFYKYGIAVVTLNNGIVLDFRITKMRGKSIFLIMPLNSKFIEGYMYHDIRFKNSLSKDNLYSSILNKVEKEYSYSY